MATFILSHYVKDFASWKPIYDGDAERRTSAGFTELAVGTQEGDPKKVIMIWQGDSIDAAKKMMQDPELKKKMEIAGVVSPPEMVIIN
jgi:hypothetical protein